MSVAVRAMGRLDARAHGHIADSVGAADAERRRLRRSAAIWWGQERNTVKPSALRALFEQRSLPLDLSHGQAADLRWLGFSGNGIAAVVLLVTGRYPKRLYDLVLGLNRWVLRVAGYAGLMTDRYPPFRLHMGGTDPAP